ncbi:MAG: zinc-ribbon domain-containing protein [Myxococcota bacterium]|nr:zinc-ribbon domain-containing protein [Myxococcota bacterium]
MESSGSAFFSGKQQKSEGESLSMIIACPNCEARYRIDDARVGSAGARLRCARCRSLFRLPASSPPTAAPASLAAMLNQPAPDLPAPFPKEASDPIGSAPESSEAVLLLADPDPVRAAGFAKRLAAWGLGVARAMDGVEAFLALQRADYPIVVLSADLPRIRGGDLCEIIKGTESLKTTGVVLLRSDGAESPLSSGAQSGGAFDLEIDEDDKEGRLISFLEMHGLRVRKQRQPESPPQPAFPERPEPVAPRVSPPPVSRVSPSGADAERAKAERLARIVVSDMLLYHPERFDQVQNEESLLAEFASEIREGGLLLSKRVDAEVLSERDYLGEELRRAARQRADA